MTRARASVWVVTLFPDMVSEAARRGVIGQAIERGDLRLTTINPRDYARDRHATVDDAPYGGGPGMVMKTGPLLAAIDQARTQARGQCGVAPRVVYLAPQGARFDQRQARELAAAEAPLVLVAGRYEAVDERVIDLAIDATLSLGDFVLTGGEVPALAVLDAVCRLQPGVVGNRQSLVDESFEDGLLEYPHYTRPQVVSAEDGRTLEVPAVLMSGDHARIERWRHTMRLVTTYERRPDLLAARGLTNDECGMLRAYWAEQPV